MKLNRSEFLTQAFVMTGKDLENLLQRVAKHLPIARIDAPCGDGLTRSFETPAEFLGYDNPEGREIRELKVRARDEGFNSLSVSFSNNRSRNIFINLEAAETIATDLNETLNDHIRAMRPWFAWIARMDWYGAIVVSFFLIYTVVITVLIYQAGTINLGKLPNNVDVHRLFQGCAWGMLPAIFGILLNLVRNRAFPMGTFAVGHGERRHARLEIIRTLFVGGFFVSLIASLIVALAL